MSSEEGIIGHANDGSVVASKKRKVQQPKRPPKPLPTELAGLTDKDYDKFNLALDKDTSATKPKPGDEAKPPRELICAVSVNIPQGQGKDDLVFDLKKLTSDQHKKLASNIGVRGCGSATTFMVRYHIGSYIKTLQGLAENSLNGSVVLDEQRHINTVFRLINVCFSEPFVNDFIDVNDIKKREDHEFGTTYKQFWVRVTDAHASTDEDEELDTVIHTVTQNPDEIETLIQVTEDVNPTAIINAGVTSSYCQGKIKQLFDVRRRIQANMTTSGTHESKIWDFVHAAMAKEKTSSGMSAAACYYFFLRCNERTEIDASFQPFLSDNLKGSSIDIGQVAHGEDSNDRKRRAVEKNDTALDKIHEIGMSLFAEFKEGNATRKAIAETSSRESAMNMYLRLIKVINDPQIGPDHKEILQAEIESLQEQYGFGKRNNSQTNQTTVTRSPSNSNSNSNDSSTPPAYSM